MLMGCATTAAIITKLDGKKCRSPLQLMLKRCQVLRACLDNSNGVREGLQPPTSCWKMSPLQVLCSDRKQAQRQQQQQQ